MLLLSLEASLPECRGQLKDRTEGSIPNRVLRAAAALQKLHCIFLKQDVFIQASVYHQCCSPVQRYTLFELCRRQCSYCCTSMACIFQ